MLKGLLYGEWIISQTLVSIHPRGCDTCGKEQYVYFLQIKSPSSRSQRLSYCMMTFWTMTTPYHTTTILRPFFRDHPGEPLPEENFWTLWCKGRLTEADTHVITFWSIREKISENCSNSSTICWVFKYGHQVFVRTLYELVDASLMMIVWRIRFNVVRTVQPCPCSPMVKPLGRHVQ